MIMKMGWNEEQQAVLCLLRSITFMADMLRPAPATKLGPVLPGVIVLNHYLTLHVAFYCLHKPFACGEKPSE